MNPRLLAATTALAACLAQPLAQANPVGARVVHGNADIVNSGAGILDIINTPGAIIHWQDFSIAAGEITRFIQQGAGSAVLNRVLGGNPSEILGALQSNGQVWLINPSGIAFGAGAVVDTAGFVASTLDVSDVDFLAGRLEFAGDDAGAIRNAGHIRASGDGDVVLIAPQIENSGVIRTEDGDLVLAAGHRVTLTSLDSRHISFDLQAPDDRVVNLGALITRGGAIGAFASNVVQRGTIQADRITRDADGTIRLAASHDIEVGGTISARGRNGQTGGQVEILGANISLTRASIGVSGDGGGGRVLIGGDYQGKGDVPRSRTTHIDAASSVDASATRAGDGGEIIVWSERETATFARLSARGGPSGGDGGMIETSSRGQLRFGRPADAAAPSGRAGTWLLDPEDILIGDGEAASISEALNQGSNVSLKTADAGDGEGNITVASPIAKTEGDDAALSMQAHNRIDVNAPITSTSGRLDVNLVAGRRINVNSGITSNGGLVSTTITGVEAATTPDALATPPESDTTGEVVDTETPPAANEGSNPETDVPAPGPVVADTGGPGEIVEAAATPDALASPSEPDTSGETVEPETGISIDAEIRTAGGAVVVDGGAGGDTDVSGALVTRNTQTGTVGGSVSVLGDHVTLTRLTLDASGDAGGGEVLIGGDFQGNNPEVRNATQTFVDSDVTIRSDALTDGDGGKVIVWADENTRFKGAISARGGSNSGDGGFAEVSGKRNLAFDGVADLSAANGNTGTLLLDPVDVIISFLAPQLNDGELVDNEILEADGFGLFNISAAAIQASLNSANTTIEASNFIDVNSTISWSSGNTLTFNAGGNIDFTFGLDGGADGDIILNAGGAIRSDDINNPDPLTHLVGDTLAMSAGGLISVATGVNTVAAESTGGGDITILNEGGLSVGTVGGIVGVTTTGGGSITANSPLTINAPVTMGADFSLIAGDSAAPGDDLTINANVTHTAGGRIDLQAGDDVIFNGGVVTSNFISGPDNRVVTVVADHDSDSHGGAIIDNTPGVDINSFFIALRASDGIDIDTNGAPLSATTAGGILNIDSVTQFGSGVPVLPGVVGITHTGSGDIELSGPGLFDNNFGVSTNDGNITVTVVGEITGQAFNAGGDVFLTSTGSDINLDGLGLFVIGNNVELSADGFILAGMDANTVNFDAGGDVTLFAYDAVEITGANSGASLNFSGLDAITQAGSSSMAITGEGFFNANSGASDITLVGANDFGTLRFDGNNVVIHEDSDMLIDNGPSSASDLTLVSGGGVSDSLTGHIVATALNVSSATDIILDNPLNDVVTLIAEPAVGDILFVDANALELVGLTTNASDITVTASGLLHAANVQAGGTGSVTLTSLNDDVWIGFVAAPNGIVTINADGEIQDFEDDTLLDINAPIIVFNAPVIGGNSPSGAFNDPLGIIEVPVAAAPPPDIIPDLPLAQPLAPPLEPLTVPDTSPPEFPQLDEDIVNVIVSLDEQVPLLLASFEAEETEGEGEKVFECR